MVFKEISKDLVSSSTIQSNASYSHGPKMAILHPDIMSMSQAINKNGKGERRVYAKPVHF